MPDFQRRVWIVIEEEIGVRNEVIFVPAELRFGLISALGLKPDRKTHTVPGEIFQDLPVIQQDTLQFHRKESFASIRHLGEPQQCAHEKAERSRKCGNEWRRQRALSGVVVTVATRKFLMAGSSMYRCCLLAS
jgi:hypothetical protein